MSVRLTTNELRTSLIIWIAVSLISLHTLFFILTYGVNIPFWDEWTYVEFVSDFYDGKNFWDNNILWQTNEHRAIIPTLLLLPNVFFFSWNPIPQMILGWIFINIEILLLYYILKKTDKRLIWLLIPAAGFVFNTSQYEILIWGLLSSADRSVARPPAAWPAAGARPAAEWSSSPGSPGS